MDDFLKKAVFGGGGVYLGGGVYGVKTGVK